jgi:hypothetical protein
VNVDGREKHAARGHDGDRDDDQVLGKKLLLHGGSLPEITHRRLQAGFHKTMEKGKNGKNGVKEKVEKRKSKSTINNYVIVFIYIKKNFFNHVKYKSTRNFIVCILILMSIYTTSLLKYAHKIFFYVNFLLIRMDII